jgi:ornithine cyclodeaminase/alanine dehydrogenase
MSGLRLLAREEVAAALPGIDEQIRLARQTFEALAGGRVEMPPKIGIHPRRDAFIHAMPAYLEAEDVAAVKWVSGYPANPARGLPYIQGLIVVNDPETGTPVAVLDAAEITAARTAAASGACIEAFAPPGWSRVAILGCGEQGRYHARVVRALSPAAEIRAYDVDAGRAESLIESAVVTADARQAVDGAEIVVTAGPIVERPEPVIDASWLAERVLLLPIDFDFYVTAEAIASCGAFYVDDVEQFEYYRGQGHFGRWPAADASVGEAFVAGARPANRVACANLGVGAHDAAFAARVLSAPPDT